MRKLDSNIHHMDIGYNYEVLDEIRRLSCDWNGYGAKSIPLQVIESVRSVLEYFHENQPWINPVAAEAIQIEWHGADESYLEFVFYADKITYFEVPENKDYYNSSSEIIPVRDTSRVVSLFKSYMRGEEF